MLFNTMFHGGRFHGGSKTFSDLTASTNAYSVVANGCRLSSDGTMYHVCRTGGNAVERHNLSTPFDFTTASLANGSNTNGDDDAPSGLDFNAAGAKMWVMGSQNGALLQYTLSGAFNPNPKSSKVTFSLSGVDPVEFQVKSDYSRFYHLDEADATKVFEYSFSFENISTASYVTTHTISDGNNSGTARGFCISPDGLKIYMVYAISGVHAFSLSSAWDLSTATADNEIISQANLQGINVTSDGRVFIQSGSDVTEYT